MLRVYHSNRLDVLEALMEFIVERERLDDPFEPEMILVQSTGYGAVAADDPFTKVWYCGEYRFSVTGEFYLGDVCPRVGRISPKKALSANKA
ncbi:exonuclease V subunit [Salmonella enterica subsp. enterica]|uniref:Exonuclease V subunit n=1 Tax=Salmonella enterica I TaxID=59201 RepID=A0A447P8I9_SALET|nr:exonuclease V subunit [Salmonella enterica subsp. enterica]